MHEAPGARPALPDARKPTVPAMTATPLPGPA